MRPRPTPRMIEAARAWMMERYPGHGFSESQAVAVAEGIALASKHVVDELERRMQTLEKADRPAAARMRELFDLQFFVAQCEWHEPSQIGTMESARNSTS